MVLKVSTARVSGPGVVTAGPAKVKAWKSNLFNEGSSEVKISLYLHDN